MARQIAPTPKVNKDEVKTHLNRLANRQSMSKEKLVAETKERQSRISSSKWIIVEA